MNNDQTTKVKIWDIWIRLFHWSLAGFVLFLLVSGTTGWQFYEWHRTCGEIVLALIVFRLAWGIIGSTNARLHTLFSNPLKAFTHITELLKGKLSAERGHNAAGGWAVLTMLALIAFQAISGLVIADEEEFIEGAFYGMLSADLSYELLKLHKMNATLIKYIVLIHVVMIAIYAIRASQNLLKPMFTGAMKWPTNRDIPNVKFQHPVIGLAIAVGCFAAIGKALSWW